MAKPEILQANFQRQKLVKASRLHWFHWLIIVLSLVLTVSAWLFAKLQIDEKIKTQFHREADHVIELVSERMQKYEDALWGGVGAIRTHGGTLAYSDWLEFTNTLQIDLKYPGINGIGVIHRLTPELLPAFLAYQRRTRPEYKIHPPHQEKEYLPIAYIEPVAANAKAVGLDMAHETNRYTAAKKARDSGEARITGPIVLVQDSGKTPGFLFYAPFYHDGTYDSVEARREHFSGMVYAPFVFTKLMEGVLAKQKRQVGLRITDSVDTLYDEHNRSERDFDPQPLFQKNVNLPLYGRNWDFDIRSTKSFRAATGSNQPLAILIGGIVIDSMLFILFILLSRANRHTIQYADLATAALVRKTARLERSNEDLEQFAYVASHDLQEPLRMVGNFTQLLQQRYQGQIDEKADQYINYTVDGVKRMQRLLNELLTYSRVGSNDKEFELTDAKQACDLAVESLQQVIRASGATLTIGPLPQVSGDITQLTQLFQNLVANALKFYTEDRTPQVEINAEDRGSDWRFSVQDNGIGIEPEYFEKIFVMFQRLHQRETYEGTGVGLAICKKVVIRHGGQIWVESEPGSSTTFYFTLPKAPIEQQKVVTLEPQYPKLAYGV